MLQRLLIPCATMLVFAAIFTFVTFELIPVKYIYPHILFFEEDSPYSEEANAIGYESRFFILNSGSITIYIILIVVREIFKAILLKCFKRGKIYNYLKRSQSEFWWVGLISFFNETYLTMCFCAGINYSSMSMHDASTIGNNSYQIALSTLLALAPFFIAF